MISTSFHLSDKEASLKEISKFQMKAGAITKERHNSFFKAFYTLTSTEDLS